MYIRWWLLEFILSFAYIFNRVCAIHLEFSFYIAFYFYFQIHVLRNYAICYLSVNDVQFCYFFACHIAICSSLFLMWNVLCVIHFVVQYFAYFNKCYIACTVFHAFKSIFAMILRFSHLAVLLFLTMLGVREMVVTAWDAIFSFKPCHSLVAVRANELFCFCAKTFLLLLTLIMSMQSITT